MRRLRRFLAGFFIMLAVIVVAGAAYQVVADRRDLARVPPPGRMVDIGSHRLHLWCKGSGAPLVLMDSGLGGTSFLYNFVIDGVADFTQGCAFLFRRIQRAALRDRVSRPGHGRGSGGSVS